MADNSDLFESAWVKWCWAVAHADTLENKIRAWTRDPQRKAGIELGKRYNPKCHRIDVFVTDVQPLPVDWGLILGDVANNFRSCLDHIAWALVTRGRTPPDTLSRGRQNKIYFPIYDDGVDFNDSLPLKLPGVRRADIAVVRRYQPYKHGKLGAPLHAFALLAAISNEDKHRSVQPVPALPAHASYKIVETRDCEVTRWGGNFFATRLEVGTKLAPIYVRKKGPHPDVGVEGRLSAYPVLNHNVKLEDWLAETPRFVSALLQEFGDAPSAEFLERPQLRNAELEATASSGAPAGAALTHRRLSPLKGYLPPSVTAGPRA